MRGDDSLLMVGIQLINVKRIMELENYHLATIILKGGLARYMRGC